MEATHKIANINNKAIQQKIIADIKELPIINKHFQDEYKLVNDEAFNLPIVEISQQQKNQITKLIQ
jgi:hypothetical protein